MELIAEQVLNTNTASVTFSSIPQTFRDLTLVVNTIRSTAGSTVLGIRLNGSSANSYNYVAIEGNGSATSSPTGTDTFVTATAVTNVLNSTDRALVTYNIMDYSTNDKHIMVLLRASNPSFVTAATVNRWASFGPVTQVDVLSVTGLLATGSRFALYGIAA